MRRSPASARCSSVRNSASSASRPTSSGAARGQRTLAGQRLECNQQPIAASMRRLGEVAARRRPAHRAVPGCTKPVRVAYHPARPDRTKICSLLCSSTGSAERQQYLDRLRRDAASAGRAQQLTAVGIECEGPGGTCVSTARCLGITQVGPQGYPIFRARESDSLRGRLQPALFLEQLVARQVVLRCCGRR